GTATIGHRAIRSTISLHRVAAGSALTGIGAAAGKTDSCAIELNPRYALGCNPRSRDRSPAFGSRSSSGWRALTPTSNHFPRWQTLGLRLKQHLSTPILGTTCHHLAFATSWKVFGLTCSRFHQNNYPPRCTAAFTGGSADQWCQ